jgi:hypothetical protein
MQLWLAGWAGQAAMQDGLVIVVPRGWQRIGVTELVMRVSNVLVCWCWALVLRAVTLTAAD